jgi:hypothetical protein
MKYMDKVSFYLGNKKYVYTVGHYYLSTGCGSNAALFRDMGLNREDIVNWSSNKYGYEVSSGDWPIYRNDDFGAAGRFVDDIQRVLKIINEMRKAGRAIDHSITLRIIYHMPSPTVTIEDDPSLSLLPYPREISIEELEELGEMVTDAIEYNSVKLYSQTNIKNGKIIETGRLTPEIRCAEKCRGQAISGKTIRTATSIGYLGYREITG